VCSATRPLSARTLNEEHVALEEVDDGVYDLYSRFYLIGRYELKSYRIHDIITRVPLSVDKAAGAGSWRRVMDRRDKRAGVTMRASHGEVD